MYCVAGMAKRSITFRLTDKTIQIIKAASLARNVSQAAFLDDALAMYESDIVKPITVTVYGIRTGSHIHYVGSTYSFHRRKATHLGTKGAPRIKDVLKKGAEFFVIQECEPSQGYEIERTQIETLKKAGMCDLNLKLPGVARKPRNRIGLPVRSKATGTVYPSIEDAARSLNRTATDISKGLKEGRFEIAN